MIDKLNEKFYFIPSKVEIEKDNRLLYEKVTNEMKNYVKRRFGSLKEELIGKADKMVVDKM